jgi:hypothetical protein
VVAAVQVAVKAIARLEAMATGLAVERSPVVPMRSPPRVAAMLVPVLDGDGRGARRAAPSVPVTMPPIPIAAVMRAAVVLANAVTVSTFFGERAPIAAAGRSIRGSRQQERGQPHRCDCEARSVVAKHHMNLLLRALMASTHGLSGNSPAPQQLVLKKRAENARKSLSRRSI